VDNVVTPFYSFRLDINDWIAVLDDGQNEMPRDE
jgi:hypothetical protein